jgi:hypothetical protein
MKFILLVFAVFFAYSCAPLNSFVRQDFNKHELGLLGQRQYIADYLAMYDQMAWFSTDTLKKYEYSEIRGQLGPEWFCYRDSNRMVVSYGRFENGKYINVARYEQIDGIIRKTTDGIDSLEQIYGFMVNAVNEDAIETWKKIGVQHSGFIYEDSFSKTKKIIYLPVIGKNWEIIYNSEYEYTFNFEGDSLLGKTIKADQPRYFLPNKEKEINFSDQHEKHPLIGSLYIISRWVHLFKNISVRTDFGMTTLFWDGKGYSWVTSTSGL